MTAVTTHYGSFNEDDLKYINDCLNEISNEMSKIEQHKEDIKVIIGALYDAH
jgi:lipocalin